MRKFIHRIVLRIKQLRLSDFKVEIERGSAPSETTW